jgi:phenylalanyl-tRNA synthetase beta chain
MKVSLNWLKEFVDVPVSPLELRRDLTMLGLNTESCVQAGDDWILDVEVTTNRPDCLSHYGLAREIATFYRSSLKQLKFLVKETDPATASRVSVEIADPDLCARYCGRVLEHVEVAPSPAWLAKRLEAIGQRPINNVADATNYVLMELGHPLHAFDLDRLRGRTIIVRRARQGEPLRTLDGQTRTLTAEQLVIADATHPVALAGVMGGEESEISPATRNVLLESAWFDPISIRRTSKAHGMHTEASHRFERGADIEMARVAVERTASLIQEIAGGEIRRGVVDVYPGRPARGEITLRRSQIYRVLGAEIAAGDIERILTSLGFPLRRSSPDAWQVKLPAHRLDVTREIDLVEEVARHYSYDRLPVRVRSAPPRVEKDWTREKELAISSRLVALGYREIVPFSMVDPQENASFTDRPPVVLANPLSQEAAGLRASAVPSMLRALGWNLDRGQTDVRLFELGKTYSPQSAGLADERRVLSLGLTGHRTAPSVHETARPLTPFDLKGDLESLLEAFETPGLKFVPSAPGYFDAGTSGHFEAEGRTVAGFGRIRGDVARDYGLRQPVWVAEVDLEALLAMPLRKATFRSYSKFPAVQRDFSLVVPDASSYQAMESAVQALRLEDLRDLRAVDIFRGGGIAAGHYSLLLRATFQSATRTLTSEEVAAMSQRIVDALAALGAKLRVEVRLSS